MEGKLIGIGLPKTGTTSLAAALQRLGLRTKHFVPEMVALGWYSNGGSFCPDRLNLSLPQKYELLSRYDALVDSPLWLPEIYQDIDRKYPGTQFVLSVRDKESWIASITNHIRQERYLKIVERRQRDFTNYDVERHIVFTCDSVGLLEYMFRVPYSRMTPELFSQRYDEHHQEVSQYFRDRGQDLISINVMKDDAWQILGKRLNISVPDEEPFPHLNRKEDLAQKKLDKSLGTFRTLKQKVLERYHYYRTAGMLSHYFWNRR